MSVRMSSKCIDLMYLYASIMFPRLHHGSAGLTPVASHCREEVSARPALSSPSSEHLLVPIVVLPGVATRHSGRIRVWA